MDMTWFDDPSMMMASEDEVQHMSVAKQVESQTPVQLDPDKITCEILKPIVPAACVACRTKHLKCDGMKPCSRCASHGVECSYIRSRRGYKGPRRMAKPSTAIASTPMQSSALSSTDDGLDSLSIGSVHKSSYSTPVALSCSVIENLELEIAGPRPESPLSGTSVRERCLEAYFRYFFPAHPFTLPKFYTLNMLKSHPLPHLEAAMRYIGSYYVQSASTPLLAEEAIRCLSGFQCPRDGFAVQANLLIAIGMDASTDLKRAHEFLTEAQNIALEIGMHQRNFASLHNEGSPVMEESWRRTWWELYVVDGMIAGVHQHYHFRFFDVQSQVLLPCEEQEYISGRIPAPRSLEEFDDDEFADEDVNFSSFAYRIAAMRDFGRVLQLPEIVFADDPIIDKLDANLVNWDLHLPPSKRLGINTDGQVDEMLFQAQMIKNGCSILLHRAHSQLDTSVVRTVTSCAPHKPVAPGQAWNVHAAKIVQAAENVGKLIALPVPLVKHTPFFTCLITLSSIVHLSCWAALLPLTQDDNLKQQLRLNTGALKTLAMVWPNAQKVQHQVKVVAQEVFTNRKQAAEVGFWNTYTEGNAFTEDEMMRSLIEDESIINSFQLT